MSEIRATTISDAAGTGPVTLTKQSAAKVWCKFDGSGTATIDESFNVSSLTDVATGTFDINFTNAFASANTVTSWATDNWVRYVAGGVTTAQRIFGASNAFALQDMGNGNVSIHGDLA